MKLNMCDSFSPFSYIDDRWKLNTDVEMHDSLNESSVGDNEMTMCDDDDQLAPNADDDIAPDAVVDIAPDADVDISDNSNNTSRDINQGSSATALPRLQTTLTASGVNLWDKLNGRAKRLVVSPASVSSTFPHTHTHVHIR